MGATSIGVKILLSYAQMTALAASLDVRWAPAVQAVLSLQQACGNSGEQVRGGGRMGCCIAMHPSMLISRGMLQISSTSCLLVEMASSLSMTPVYLKAIVFVALPPLILLTIVSVWVIVYLYRLNCRKCVAVAAVTWACATSVAQLIVTRSPVPPEQARETDPCAAARDAG